MRLRDMSLAALAPREVVPRANGMRDAIAKYAGTTDTRTCASLPGFSRKPCQYSGLDVQTTAGPTLAFANRVIPDATG